MIETSILNEMLQDIKEIKSSVNKPQQKLSEQWVNNLEACKFLHISVRTMASKRYNGEIAYSKSGRKISYRMSDLQLYLEKHIQKAFKN